jgi:hypothetical protein
MVACAQDMLAARTAPSLTTALKHLIEAANRREAGSIHRIPLRAAHYFGRYNNNRFFMLKHARLKTGGWNPMSGYSIFSLLNMI